MWRTCPACTSVALAGNVRIQPPPRPCPAPTMQDDTAAYPGEVVAAGDARTHQQAIDLLRWQQ